ncbi:MAG: cellulase family glycosylhydrolase [Firmicutes bacterium]|nr:cellulase family glycosylhydrolase [Bacillota bacterium]
MKKWISLLLTLCLAVCMVSTVAVSAAENTQTVSGQQPFRVLSASEMVAEMGTGWNLGNTFDGHTGLTPNETVWQNTVTTQALIKAIHDMGFNTIRIPITWGTMIQDDYSVDETWMSRVQDVVDYAINMGMYVIINMHHDGADNGYWFNLLLEDQTEMKAKYAGLWTTIAERFKDYDEHLIFESMNEVTGYGTSASLADDTALVCEYNQIFVDAVRATGSNNAERWLSVPGRYTNIEATTSDESGFHLPTDTVENRIFVAVHDYDWTFGMLENLNDTDWSYSNSTALQARFELMKEFTDADIPVILGEYGAINKLNETDRAYYAEMVNRICQQCGMVPVWWDQGWYDLTMEPDYSYTLVDRETCEIVYPEIVSAIMRGYYLAGEDDLSDVEYDTTVVSIPSIPAVDAVSMTVGEVTSVTLDVDKSAYNDVVLWKSSDESVATVCTDASDLENWTAFIHSTGIGTCVITGYTQSGSASVEIPVTVGAASGSTTIEVDSSLTLAYNTSWFLNATASGDGTLTYRSANPEVATVSKLGKVVAISEGSTQIIITATTGETAVVQVTVEGATTATEIQLALNVYYNDSTNNYYSNEYGEAITVTGDGTYTLSFDCETDLSDSAVSAGVSSLSNLTAIYIKDHMVTLGKQSKSQLESCDILYTKIVVDGVEFAVNMDSAKSALKASGIFDTNDPINSWDGSVIDEVTVDDHVLNFEGLENPTHIEVTFELSNLVFSEVEPTASEQATYIETTETAVSVRVGESVELSVASDSELVAFVAEDASVLAVPALASSSGVTATGLREGSTTVTAYTENGYYVNILVTVEAAEETEPTTAEEPEQTDATASATSETDSGSSSGLGAVQIALLVVGILAIGVAAFFITMKLSGGAKKE